MKKFTSLRNRVILLFTAISTFTGGAIMQITTCSQNAVRISQNPTNQAMVVEATSFIANMFYEGADDPLPTPGAGGETAKFARIILCKGDKAFKAALQKIGSKSGVIIETSQRWVSSHIQHGARAIHKKTGHAQRGGFVSAFEGLQANQHKAEEVISDIINNADAIILRPKQIKLYLPNGKGLNIRTKDAGFTGFVERLKEDAL